MEVELPDEAPPVKVCPNCSVQEHTTGMFCPHCGASYTRRKRRRPSRRVKYVLVLLAAALVGGAAIAVIAKRNHDRDVNARAATRQRLAAEAAADTRASQRKEAAAKRALDRGVAAILVHEMEKSISKDARRMVAAGALDGPILHTECSTTDPSANRVAKPYSCLAVTDKNGDGSQSGYRFSATANLKAGSYRWQLGD